MRQQFLDPARGPSRQAGEDVLEVGVRLVPVHPRRLDQAHDRSGALAGAKRSGEQPVGSSKGNFVVILPMSGRKSKFTIAGIRSSAGGFGSSTARSGPVERWSTSRSHPALLSFLRLGCLMQLPARAWSLGRRGWR